MTIAPEQNPNEFTPPKPELSAEEALAQLGHATTEEQPAAEAVTTVNTHEDTPQRAGFSTKAKVAAAVGAGLLAATGGGIAAGVAIANNSQEQVQEDPDAAPVDEQPVVAPSPSDMPNATPTTSVPVETVAPVAPGEIVAISPEITDANEIVKQTFSLLISWRNYGEDRAMDVLQAGAEGLGGNEALKQAKLDSIAEEAAATFTPLLFTEEYAADASLVKFHQEKVDQQKTALEIKSRTIPEIGAGDIEIYKVSSDIEEVTVVSQTDDSLIVEIAEHTYDNNELNRVGEALTNGSVLDTTGVSRMIYTRTDTGWKLRAVQTISHVNNG